MLTASTRRLAAVVVTLVAGAAVFLGPPVSAGPGLPLRDPEGGTKALRDQLDLAARGYLEAKARYDSSKTFAAALGERMKATELHLGLLIEQVGAVAAMSYRTGRLGAVSALLDSASPDAFLQRATQVETLALHEDAQLRQLVTARRELNQQQDRLALELRIQAAQLAVMEKRKKDAEKALVAAGGGRVSGGFVSARSAAAQPAPRNSDGSWPRESCTVDDPTTSGCLTPRTYHAYLQTKAAGFNHYVSCYRPSGDGEHPKGRACDWAAAVSGFGGVATGSEKTYGDRLANFYLANADRLAVMYVIWYRQIWMPGLGWRSYSGGNGDPASDHTNHVHLSVL
jgi:hypothetical protein